MFTTLRSLFSPAAREAQVNQHLEQLRERLPLPVFWLFGKTQSGKTSIIRYLTGASDAQIGQGFRPCTRFSRRYQFPSAETPLVTFLDTRGLEEPGYDPQEDLAAFDREAQVMIVTVKATDHAQERVLASLQVLRKAQPTRPVLLALTCLHEVYPQKQHPAIYPFDRGEEGLPDISDDLRRTLDEQKRRFEGLFDAVVPIDLTPAEEGFHESNYGGPQLRKSLLELLPSAYRQTLIALDETTGELQDLYEKLALPHIIGYSSLAAGAGAIPVPWIDLLILPAIQTRLVQQIAEIYHQEFNAARFAELAGTLGLGLVLRQAAREVTKLVPFVGSIASGALAGASTFALGKAVCFYYGQIHKGHVPKGEDIRRYYREQLAVAERHWAHPPTPLVPQANGTERGGKE
jgi:uncharacterized protein (DUF697 family)